MLSKPMVSSETSLEKSKKHRTIFKLSSVYTEDISSVYTEDISSVYTEDRSSVATEEISSVATEEFLLSQHKKSTVRKSSFFEDFGLRFEIWRS